MTTPSNTDIKSLYSFLLQQMAAESYFEGVPLSDLLAAQTQLKLGANRLGHTIN